MNDRFEQIMSAAAETCEWVWSTPFAKWLQETKDPEIFWITGKPGSGKSTLMKYLVKTPVTRRKLQFAMEGKSWKIVHFFYNFRVNTNLANREEGMLRSVLEQVLQALRSTSGAGEHNLDHERMNDIAKSAFVKDEDTAATIVRFLQLQAVNILLLIDGLDECGSNLRQMVRTLKDIQKQTNIRLCLASRPEAVLLASLRDTRQIKMQELNHAGIKSYANTILREVGSLLDLSTSAVGALLEEVTARADGVFLFVHFTFELIMQRLVQGLTIAEIRLEIRTMPQELSTMYDRIFDGIPLICRAEVAFVLDLLEHGPRELSLDRLFRAWYFFKTRLEGTQTVNLITTLDQFKTRMLGLLGTVIELKEHEEDQAGDLHILENAAELPADPAVSAHSKLIQLANELSFTRFGPLRNRTDRTTISLMHETVRNYMWQMDLIRKWASPVQLDRLPRPIWPHLHAEILLDSTTRLGNQTWTTLDTIFKVSYDYWLPLSRQSITENDGMHGRMAIVDVFTKTLIDHSKELAKAGARLQALAVVDALDHIYEDLDYEEKRQVAVGLYERIGSSFRSPLILLYDVARYIDRDVLFDMRYILEHGRLWHFEHLFWASQHSKDYTDVHDADLAALPIDEWDYLTGCALHKGITVWNKTVWSSSRTWVQDLTSRISDNRGFQGIYMPVLIRWTVRRPRLLHKQLALPTTAVICSSEDVSPIRETKDIIKVWAEMRPESWMHFAPNAAFWRVSLDILIKYGVNVPHTRETNKGALIDIVLDNHNVRWPLSITVYKLEAISIVVAGLWTPERIGGIRRVRLENILQEKLHANKARHKDDEVVRSLRRLIAMITPQPKTEDAPISANVELDSSALSELVLSSAYFGHALDTDELEEAFREYVHFPQSVGRTRYWTDQLRWDDMRERAVELEADVPQAFLTRGGLSPNSALSLSRVASPGHTSPSMGYAEWRTRHRRARSRS